jgi:hypothetical protein
MVLSQDGLNFEAHYFPANSKLFIDDIGLATGSLPATTVTTEITIDGTGSAIFSLPPGASASCPEVNHNIVFRHPTCGIILNYVTVSSYTTQNNCV